MPFLPRSSKLALAAFVAASAVLTFVAGHAQGDEIPNLTERERAVRERAIAQGAGAVTPSGESKRYVAPDVRVHERVVSRREAETAGDPAAASRWQLSPDSRGTAPTVVQVLNGNFETGTLASWTSSGNQGSPGIACSGPPHAGDTFIQAAGTLPEAANDPTMPATFGGQYAGKIGDQTQWDMPNPLEPQCSALDQDFVVPASDPILTFSYAVVAIDGQHGVGYDPFFHVMVSTDGSMLYEVKDFTSVVNTTPPCAPWCPGAPAGPQQWIYRRWTTVSLDLSSRIGQTVNLKFLAADCTGGAHPLFVLIDDVGMSSNCDLQLPCADLYQDTFPFNETVTPGTADFDTTTALMTTGRNIVVPETISAVVAGDTLLARAPYSGNGVTTGVRMDLVFRIDPGPGNYTIKGNRASSLVNKDPSHPFFAAYLANNGPFGTPGGHGATWNRHVWNSARMDTAQINVFPIVSRGIGLVSSENWMSALHEADPKFASLGITKNVCFLVNPNGAEDHTNIDCSGTPPGVYGAVSGITKEFTKILPDGWFSPGAHIEYFVRRSLIEAPSDVAIDFDTTRVTLQNCGRGDHERWASVDVLPDLWKSVRFGGDSLACMLIVDAADPRGEQNFVLGALDTLGYGKKNGASVGWFGGLGVPKPPGFANPDDPSDFVAANLGQVGRKFDWFDVTCASSVEAGHLGTRLALNSGLIANKKARQGPTLAMMNTYYTLVGWFQGDAPNTLQDGDGFAGSKRLASNDVDLLYNWLNASSAVSRRAMWLNGDDAVDNWLSFSGINVSQMVSLFGNTYGAGSYNATSGVTSNPMLFTPLTPTFQSPSPNDTYGMSNESIDDCDVIPPHPSFTTAVQAAYYETDGSSDYGASVFLPSNGTSRHFSTLIDGFRYSLLKGDEGADPVLKSQLDTGRHRWMQTALTALAACDTFPQRVPPPPGSDSCMVAADTCCARPPVFSDPAFAPFLGKPVIATTSWAPSPGAFPLAMFDVSAAPTQIATPWLPPVYHGPPAFPWTRANLGDVFGVTMTPQGNLFATATAVYAGNFSPSFNADAGGGSVWKIDGVTGAGTLSLFATLPNVDDTRIPITTERLPGLGNIAYDCRHHRLFVSNFEDGKIYRLDPGATYSPVQVQCGQQGVTCYDHGCAQSPVFCDDGGAGWAPLLGSPQIQPRGERVWGVAVRGNRLYYGVWNDDEVHPSTTVSNEVWSVGLDGAGDFIPNTAKRELQISPVNLPVANIPGGQQQWSAPPSDLGFTGDGRLLIAERGVRDVNTMPASFDVIDWQRAYPTSPRPHASRVLEYRCVGTGWSLIASKHLIGQSGFDAAGGIAWSPLPAPGGRVWATGDYLRSSPQIIYGAQGLPTSGGSVANSNLIDLDGVTTSYAKTEIGDVAAACYSTVDTTGSISGRKLVTTNLQAACDSAVVAGQGWTIQIRGPAVKTAVTDAVGFYQFTNLPPGSYTVSEVAAPGWISLSPPTGSYAVTLAAGQIVQDLDFCNWHCVPNPCFKFPRFTKGYWDLGDIASAGAYESVSDLRGLVRGGPVVVDSPSDGAVRFDSSDDFLEYPNADHYDIGASDFTIFARVRIDSIGALVPIIDKRQPTSGGSFRGYTLYVTSSRSLGLFVGTGTQFANSSTFPGVLAGNGWHDVQVTLQQGSPSAAIWVDGVLRTTSSTGPIVGSFANTAPTRIGQRAAFDPPASFKGEIDEVILAGAALPQGPFPYLGPCKAECSVPKITTYGLPDASRTINLEICNMTGTTDDFTWTIAGLPITANYSTIAGPTSFTDASGTIPVPGGKSVKIPISIDRPDGLAGTSGTSPIAGYQVTIVNKRTGECYTCRGKLGRASRRWWVRHQDIPSRIAFNESAPVTFHFDNLELPGNLSEMRFEFDVRSHDEDDSTTVLLSLDGLPAGQNPQGNATIAVGETFDVSTIATWASPEPFHIQEVVLRADLDEDGVMEDVAAVPLSLAPRSTSIVSVPAPEPVTEARWIAGAWPNPFTVQTALRFQIAARQRVRVDVYDVLGRHVRKVHDDWLEAGTHALPWDGRTGDGVLARPGFYVARIQSAESVEQVRLFKVK